MVSYMNLSINLVVQFISILVLTVFDDPMNVITNYVALLAVATLDEVYYISFNSPLKTEMEERGSCMTLSNNNNVDLTDGISCLNKILLSTLNIF